MTAPTGKWSEVDVLFAPAEYAALPGKDLADATCVVFDILRATSTMVEALAGGAESIRPVGEISEALELRRRLPAALLAGERHGLRITAELTGGVEFDLGNSPREFVPSVVAGKTIVMTTTNGTRALRACAHGGTILIGSFLNLSATADWLRKQGRGRLLLICAGTIDHAAYEDTLAAGALLDLLWPELGEADVFDSCLLARETWLRGKAGLEDAIQRGRNGQRLRQIPELRDDLAFCARLDRHALVAGLQNGDRIVKIA